MSSRARAPETRFYAGIPETVLYELPVVAAAAVAASVCLRRREASVLLPENEVRKSGKQS